MLKENIHSLRKAKGLSQEALAEKLHVVRQTVSKWEKGLSVPDAELLLSLAEALDTSASTLLGETIPEKRPEEETVGSLSKKLEAVNLRLAQKSKNRLRAVRCLLIFLCVLIAAIFLVLAAMGSGYLTWDLSDPELAAAGTLLHGFEFLFVRLAPFVLLGAAIGLILTYRKR